MLLSFLPVTRLIAQARSVQHRHTLYCTASEVPREEVFPFALVVSIASACPGASSGHALVMRWSTSRGKQILFRAIASAFDALLFILCWHIRSEECVCTASFTAAQWRGHWEPFDELSIVMADYDGFGYQDSTNYQTANISATELYPRGGHHGSESNTYHGTFSCLFHTHVLTWSLCTTRCRTGPCYHRFSCLFLCHTNIRMHCCGLSDVSHLYCACLNKLY